MKTISLTAFLFATLINYAFATEGSIILNNELKPLKVSNIEFNVDKSGLGRAWLTVDVVYDDFDDFDIETVRTKIPGLVHDTASKEILLNGVVCARTKRVKKRRLFRKSKWITKISKTGNCRFRARIARELTTIDDGYDVVTERKYIVKITSNL